MAARKLQASEIGLPGFVIDKQIKIKPSSEERSLSLFDLSSHRRAREAIEFALHIKEAGYNIFVIGEDRSGRMTASLDFLKRYTKDFPKPKDWVYVHNFKHPNKPKPYAFPSGQGHLFREDMKNAVAEVKRQLQKVFSAQEYLSKVQKNTEDIEEQIGKEIDDIRQFASTYGLDLQRAPDGNIVVVLEPTTPPKTMEALTPEERAKVEEGSKEIRRRIELATQKAREKGILLNEKVQQLRSVLTDEVIAPILDRIEQKYIGIPGLSIWLVELRADMLENASLFLVAEKKEADLSESIKDMELSAEERYGVNVLTDHTEDAAYPVIVEPTPTYENLFGSIKYRGGVSGYETNFMFIQPGSLHKANGGILIIRADAIVQYAAAWEALKAALRDKEIRMEDAHRSNGVPMLMAPEPKPIPLDVKIVLVGAPRWYNTFFFADNDFQSYFKIKADIDNEITATAENLEVYCGLIQASCASITGYKCNAKAIEVLLEYAVRKAEQRDKLTAQYELLEDVIAEAGTFAHLEKSSCLTDQHICKALETRRFRNARVEELFQEEVLKGSILIDTEGSVIGQVNGLTVMQMGGYAFGMPARITARTYVGSLGVVNIERMTDMGGPIQQKGVMELEGFLHGTFAQNFPISFGCSITFEQNYGQVEGDSASMGELCAVLSSLAEIPIRQDIAITGSVNQMGSAQAVGGVNEKIEGFFRICSKKGLTGKQGVIIPAMNEKSLCLHWDVQQAVKEEKFHIWSVENVGEALQILTGFPVGTIYEEEKDSVLHRAYKKLETYEKILSEQDHSKRQRILDEKLLQKITIQKVAKSKE